MSQVRMRVPPTLYGPTWSSTSDPFSSSNTEVVGGTENIKIIPLDRRTTGVLSYKLECWIPNKCLNFTPIFKVCNYFIYCV